ncbi:MAG: hypothetical protein NC548_45925 [Lachnospiraceae bacterium]|nr:hypothetical protein [Lachnospiraceae bacterium]
MFESFIISLVANIATSTGAGLINQITGISIYRKIENAYFKALKKWCKNQGVIEQEQIWTQKRLDELTYLMSDPSKETEIDKSTLNLLSLFKSELLKDTATWQYLQSEFLKKSADVLQDVKRAVFSIQQDIAARKIDPIDLKNKLIEQTSFQINKNVVSRKYIPDTFMEINELKDHIRYFSDPVLFYNRIYEKVANFNFEYLNRQIQGLFQFDATTFAIGNNTDFRAIYQQCDDFIAYLKKKQNELCHNGNKGWVHTHKIDRRTTDLEYISKRLCVITANAGQGKTNFLCDFANNVLIKRNIPTLYINGYEIDASAIEHSLAHAVYPANTYSFAEIIDSIKSYCRNTQTPFVIIVDGLNENGSPQLLSANLCNFIRELINHEHIKIILTCRTEYYKERFADIEKLFPEQTIRIDHLHAHLNDAQKERLLNNYLNYFEIQANLSEEIKTELTKNLLLLRIFAEAYSGQTLSFVNDLHKDELFETYYQKLCNDISRKLSADGYSSVNARFIQRFIGQIIIYMIDHEQFSNIPILDGLEQTQIDLYCRFLDENILLRRDLVVSLGVFGKIEVVNFTYDEFRDYLISCYLIDTIYPKFPDRFESFVAKYTHSTQQVAEGLRSFLFLLSKKHSDKKIHTWLKNLDWYKTAFINHIWDIDDKYINDDDIALIEELLPVHNNYLIPRLLFIGRWDAKRFPKLNIHILLKYLATLSDSDLQDKVYSIWRSETDYWYRAEDKKWRQFLLLHKELLPNQNFFQNSDAHNIFEFFLYLTPFSYDAVEIYEAYLKTYGNKEQLLKVKDVCHSDRLKQTIGNLLNKL